MKIDDIDVDAAINSARELLGKEKGLSPALRSALEVLLLLVTLLLNRTTLNSKNSSKPPSTDPHREKTRKRRKSDRKPGVINDVMGLPFSRGMIRMRWSFWRW